MSSGHAHLPVSTMACIRWICKEFEAAFWCGVCRPGERHWIYSNGKHYTLQKDHLAMNFRQSIIIVELWWPEVAGRRKKLNFLLSLKNEFCSKSFHRNTDRRVVFKFHEIWPTGIGKVVRYLLHKKKQNFAWLSSSHYSMDSAQNVPGPVLDNVLRVLQISSKSVHFRRSYTRTREHHQNGP